MIHRDLKPASVRVTPDGVVKVLDFGLAKALTEEPAESAPVDSPTIHLLLRRCLTKDRDNRLHDIADARIEIQDVLSAESAGGPPRLEVRDTTWRRIGGYGAVLQHPCTHVLV